MLDLRKSIKFKGWTQQQTAAFFGESQPRISNLMKREIGRYSVDKLINMLIRAGDAGRNLRQATGSSIERETNLMNESAIRLHIEPLDEGGYLATSPDVPGLVAEGRSVSETAEIAQGLVRRIAESCIEHGDPLPRALATLPEGNASIDLLVPVSVP